MKFIKFARPITISRNNLIDSNSSDIAAEQDIESEGPSNGRNYQVLKTMQ